MTVPLAALLTHSIRRSLTDVGPELVMRPLMVAIFPKPDLLGLKSKLKSLSSVEVFSGFDDEPSEKPGEVVEFFPENMAIKIGRQKSAKSSLKKIDVFLGFAPHCGQVFAVVLIWFLHSLQAIIAMKFSPFGIFHSILKLANQAHEVIFFAKGANLCKATRGLRFVTPALQRTKWVIHQLSFAVN